MLARCRIFAGFALLVGAGVSACPFCASESRTLTEEISDSSAVLLVRLASASEASAKLAGADVPPAFIDPETGVARFAVERVLVGEDLVRDAQQVEAIYFGEPDTERLYLLRGVGTPPDWSIPLPLSEVAVEYIGDLLTLPAEGADRLAFFQRYLRHEDPLLAQDAYDEFARAPYQAVIDLGSRMDRRQLLEWIEDGQVSPSRRRLFLTMLGVCGEAEDLTQIEAMLASDGRALSISADAAMAVAQAAGGCSEMHVIGESIRVGERRRKLGLDALVACYLTLAGKHGDPVAALQLIDDRYLRNPEADYSHIYSVLQALRFLADEQAELVPLERVLVSARLLLDNDDFADQVIPDLSRWEDWSVLDRLVQMFQDTFKELGGPIKYVREPIFTYLDVAAQQPGAVGEQAAEALAKIEPMDPQAANRARSLLGFGLLARARAKKAEAPWEADEAGPSGEQELSPADPASPSEPADAVASEMPPNPQPPEPVAPASERPAAPVAAAVSVDPAPPTPPSRALLIAAPLAATAALIGLFWLILRGGVA